jgi:pyruvate, orthophosphate dikinase
VRLNEIRHELETLFYDAQDFEFTVQSGAAKRTGWAAVAIAVDMVEEGLLKPAEALARLDGIDLKGVVRTSFAPPVPDTDAACSLARGGLSVPSPGSTA